MCLVVMTEPTRQRADKRRQQTANNSSRSCFGVYSRMKCIPNSSRFTIDPASSKVGVYPIFVSSRKAKDDFSKQQNYHFLITEPSKQTGYTQHCIHHIVSLLFKVRSKSVCSVVLVWSFLSSDNLKPTVRIVVWAHPTTSARNAFCKSNERARKGFRC